MMRAVPSPSPQGSTRSPKQLTAQAPPTRNNAVWARLNGLAMRAGRGSRGRCCMRHADPRAYAWVWVALGRLWTRVDGDELQGWLIGYESGYCTFRGGHRHGAWERVLHRAWRAGMSTRPAGA